MSDPETLRDALPYPLPVITPIWEPSHNSLFTLPWAVCLLFTLSVIIFDNSTFSAVGDGKGGAVEVDGEVSVRTLAPARVREPTIRPPNLSKNPLSANEHSCGVDRGDLNSGFVMT